MRGLVACLLVGCGFHPGLGELDPDAAAPGDASDPPADGVMVAACTLAISGGATPAPGVIGGTSGTARTPATCADGELPIGLGFDVSQNPISNHADQVAMVNLRVRCGQVARRTDGVFVTTPMETFESIGGMGGNCSAYFPTVVADEVVCPAGHVLVGVTGNRLDDTLYNTVAIQCAALAIDGSVTAQISAHPIANTGANNNQPMAAVCPAGTAIASFGIRSGCGHDQLAPQCAALACP